jgi:HTH-type transcriptional regulator, competence development regulator
MASFGTLLREQRRLAGISQRELAAKANLDFSYISKLENDRIPPPAAETIVTLSRILASSPQDLLAAGGKLPQQTQEVVSTSPAAQEFLESAAQMRLTEEEWRKIATSLHRLRER